MTKKNALTEEDHGIVALLDLIEAQVDPGKICTQIYFESISGCLSLMECPWFHVRPFVDSLNVYWYVKQYVRNMLLLYFLIEVLILGLFS
jgi:hypothetical protein